jgi:hypothetical protein
MERLFDNVDPNIFGPSKAPGVYAVCVKNGYGKKYPERIIYIGSSQDIHKRLLSPNHVYKKCYQKFDVDRPVYTKEILTENYKELEKELIRVYRPLLNKQHKD